MFGQKFVGYLSTVATFLFLTACSQQSGTDSRGQYAPGLSDDSTTVVVQNSSSSSSSSSSSGTGITLGCGVSVSQDTVASGQTFSITVTASGGTAPYKLKTVTNYGTFSSTQTVTGYLNNTTSSNRIVEVKFGVNDSLGNEGACYYKVTVLPQGSAVPVSNGCSLNMSPVSPVINNFANLTITPSYSGAYVLKALQLQNDWTIYPNTSNSGAIAYQVKYTTLGQRTVTAVIRQNNQDYTCSLAANVVSSPVVTPVVTPGVTPTPTPVAGPNVNINVSPALSLPVGSTFFISLNHSGFAASPAPTIQVNSNDQTISVVASGAGYNVTGDGTPRTFIITANVSQGTGASAISATKSITLAFTAIGATPSPTPTATPNAAVCTISAPAVSLVVGQIIAFPIAIAGNPNDAVLYNFVNAGLNAIVAPSNGSPVQIKFTTPGPRQIVISGARSGLTGAPCNGSGTLILNVNIESNLNSCDAILSPNVSIAGTVIKAKIGLPAAAGNGPFEAAIETNSPDFSVIKVVGALESMVRFKKPGTYPVTMKVKDLSTGAQTQCQTVHQAIPAQTFAVAQDSTGNKVRVFRGVPAQEIFPGGLIPFADVMPNFRGGIRVALADINADGVVDLVTGAGYNGGLRVRAFDGKTFARIRDFQAFGGVGMNNVYVAAGDLDADGFADIVVGAGDNASSSVGPRVEIYSGKTGMLMAGFVALNTVGGARVAVGDVNGDGYSDIIASSTNCAEIRGFSGKNIANQQPFAPLLAFNAYPGVDTSVTVAVGDVNGDGFADIITGTGGKRSPVNKIYSGNPAHNLSVFYSLTPFNGKLGTNYVGAGDVNGDGLADVIVGGDGTLEPEEVKVFNSNGFSELIGPTSFFGSLFPFPGGCERLFVAGGAGAL